MESGIGIIQSLIIAYDRLLSILIANFDQCNSLHRMSGAVANYCHHFM